VVSIYGFVSGRSTHAERLKTIRHAHQTYTTLIDPHTADALNVALKLRDPAVPMLVLETALPAKFEETMIEAMGSAPPRPAGFEGIEKLPLRVTRMGTDVAALKEFIARETGL
jgi:threonine synthase